MLWVSLQVPSTPTLAPPSDSLLVPTTWKFSAGQLLGSQTCGSTLPQRLRPTAELRWQCQAPLRRPHPLRPSPATGNQQVVNGTTYQEICVLHSDRKEGCVWALVYKYILQPTLKYISNPPISTQLVDCKLLSYVR